MKRTIFYTRAELMNMGKRDRQKTIKNNSYPTRENYYCSTICTTSSGKLMKLQARSIRLEKITFSKITFTLNRQTDR